MTVGARQAPASLRIGGQQWRIRFRRGSLMDSYGATDYEKATIDVANDQTPFDTRDTVLHEALHAILAHQGHTTFGNEEEERYVRSISLGLMGVLQDNPEFAQWLIQPLSSNPP